MRVFISYSSKTRDMVEQLVQDLEAMGNVIWFDRELTGGRKWWADILEQIRLCDLFVFTLTPHALDSQPCKLEYTYANALKKRILPVLLTDVSVKGLPAALQELQIVDFRERTTAQILALNKALAHLPEALPLPDPLPPEPDTPLAPFTRLNDRIGAVTLSSDEQTLLLFDLKGFLEEGASPEEATSLLDAFLQRADLLARIERELKSIQHEHRPTKPVKSRPTALTPPIFRHPDTVISVAFSPDGNYIGTGGLDTKARIWEVETRTEIFVLAHKHTVFATAFSPDGGYFLTGSEDRGAYLWSTETGELIHKFAGHTSTVLSVAFSPDGLLALTGSADQTARLWDVQTGEMLQIFSGHTRGIRPLLFFDGTVFTASTDNSVRRWDIASGRELFSRTFDNEVTSPVSCIDLSSDARFVAISDENAVRKFDLVEVHPAIWEQPYRVRCLAFSPDGKFLLMGSKDTTAQVWDASNGNVIHKLIGHTGTVLAVTFSRDGRYVLTGSVDRTARIWDINTS